MENIIIDNNSTAQGYYVNSYQAIFIAKNIKLELPNYAFSGIQSRNNDSFIDGLWMVGGGTSCQSAVVFDNGIRPRTFTPEDFRRPLVEKVKRPRGRPRNGSVRPDIDVDEIWRKWDETARRNLGEGP